MDTIKKVALGLGGALLAGGLALGVKKFVSKDDEVIEEEVSEVTEESTETEEI